MRGWEPSAARSHRSRSRRSRSKPRTRCGRPSSSRRRAAWCQTLRARRATSASSHRARQTREHGRRAGAALSRDVHRALHVEVCDQHTRAIMHVRTRCRPGSRRHRPPSDGGCRARAEPRDRDRSRAVGAVRSLFFFAGSGGNAGRRTSSRRAVDREVVALRARRARDRRGRGDRVPSRSRTLIVPSRCW